VKRFGPAGWQIVSFGAALAGAGVAAYLTRVHYDEDLLICTVGDCKTVQQSEYSELWGVPVALFGLGMYLTLLALGIIRWRRPELHDRATLTAFAMALAGALYAAYLTYLELFVIDAVCQWCVVSAILTVVILIAEGIGVWGWMGPVESRTTEEDMPVRPTKATATRASRH
jgi:uncharacterized membrane protein